MNVLDTRPSLPGHSSSISATIITTKAYNLPFDFRVDQDALYEPENREMLSSILPGNYGPATDYKFLGLILLTDGDSPQALAKNGRRASSLFRQRLLRSTRLYV